MREFDYPEIEIKYEGLFKYAWDIFGFKYKEYKYYRQYTDSMWIGSEKETNNLEKYLYS